MEERPLEMTFCVPCLFGLEGLIADELKRLRIDGVHADNGRIFFQGDELALARANIGLRMGERVLIELGSFEATSFDSLFEQTKALPWERFIPKDAAFPVTGHSLNSTLFSVSDCQKIIKKAVVERLKQVYHLSWFPETAETVQIRFSIMKDRVSLCLDTSGVGLHKRGYRRNSNAAPIKETLAAGIIDLARVRPDSIVCDPFCGSGTLLIEAAMKALRIPVGINRRFAAEKWGSIPSSVWQEERKCAIDGVDRSAEFRAIGFDIDDAAVALTLDNAHKAGIKSRIKVEQADIDKFVQPEDSIVICNPPYGERLLELREAEDIYRRMGRVLGKGGSRQSYIISPHEQFEKFFGENAKKRRKLYNGMIKCQLYMYF